MATSEMQYIQDLEAIRALPQRYSRAVDARDHDAVEALFHPEAQVEGMRGIAAIADYMAGMRAAPANNAAGMHVLGDPLISFTEGANEAEIDTYAVVYQIRDASDPSGDLTLGMRYFDRLVRTNGEWLITHRRTVNIWMRGALPS